MATSKTTTTAAHKEAKTQAERLAEPFPASILKKVKQGNAVLDYIPVAEVVQRMNTVLGPGNWSRKIVYIGHDEVDPSYIVAHVSVTAKIDGDLSVSDAVGAKKIMRSRNTDDIVDLGNDYKSAYSEAMKKACQGFGVGLYLARPEEDAGDVLPEPSEPAPRQPSPPAQQSEISDEEWARLVEYLKQLDETQLDIIRGWWRQHGVGDKPLRSTVTRKLFEELVARITTELFDGEVVTNQPF